jgi:hypothetical protein
MYIGGGRPGLLSLTFYEISVDIFLDITPARGGGGPLVGPGARHLTSYHCYTKL